LFVVVSANVVVSKLKVTSCGPFPLCM